MNESFDRHLWHIALKNQPIFVETWGKPIATFDMSDPDQAKAAMKLLKKKLGRSWWRDMSRWVWRFGRGATR